LLDAIERRPLAARVCRSYKLAAAALAAQRSCSTRLEDAFAAGTARPLRALEECKNHFRPAGAGRALLLRRSHAAIIAARADGPMPTANTACRPSRR